MATAERERPPVVLKTEREMTRQRSLGDALAANAARVLWVAGLIYLIGSLADLVLLLGVNRGWGQPAWEMNALPGTLEGMPRIALAVAMIWVALYIRGASSLVWYRVLGVLLIVAGVATAVFGAMVVSDFFIIRGGLPPTEARVAMTVVLKALTMSGLQTFLYVPIGVMSVRRPRV